MPRYRTKEKPGDLFGDIMGHNIRVLVVVISSLVGIVMLDSKTASAQQVIEVDGTRDAPDRSQPPRVWDAKTSVDVLTLKGHSNGVVSATFCQDGERVVTGGADCTARVWDTKTGAQLVKIDKTGFNGCYASVNPDGSRILTTNYGYVKLWDAKTGNELLDLTRQVGLGSPVFMLTFRGSFSPDGKRIVTCSPVVRVAGENAFNLKLRDAKTGEELVTLKGQLYWPHCSAFSPDGSQVATCCESGDDAARVWDSKTGAELFALKGHGGSVWSVCFAPDGKQIATGGGNGTVHLWDAKTGAELLTLLGHKRVATGISFSPDGKWILTGSQDSTARIWDAKMGTELFVLKGHSDIVNDAEFSRDGNRIVTASGDRTARIWDFRRFLDTNSPDAKVTPPPKPK